MFIQYIYIASEREYARMRVTHPLKIKKLNWGIQNFGHKKTIISMIAIKKINIKKSLKTLIKTMIQKKNDATFLFLSIYL